MGKHLLPRAVVQHVLGGIAQIRVDGVIPLGAAQAGQEGQLQHLLTLAQVPEIRLGARQPGAVNAGLLARAHADGLTVLHEAHGVGLGVLQGNQGNDEIPHGGIRQILIFGDDIFQQSAIDFKIVPALFEGHAEDLLALQRVGDVIGIDAHHVVRALFLGLQNFQGLGGIARRDHAVGHLALTQPGGGGVAFIGKGDPVAEGGHPVRAPGPGVGAGQGGIVQALHVFHKAGLLQLLGQLQAHGGGGGADVLEGGGGAQTQGLLQFLHQLPAVQRVQKIDVPGSSAEDFHGQIAVVVHINAGGLLVGVAAVLQGKFFHFSFAPSPLALIRRSSYSPVTGSV